MTTQTFSSAAATFISPQIPSAIVVREVHLRPGAVADLDMAGIQPTAYTMVTVQVSGNELRLSSVARAGDAPGRVCWDVPVVTIVKSIGEFAGLIGANGTNTFVKVQNLSTVPAHFRILFTNVEE